MARKRLDLNTPLSPAAARKRYFRDRDALIALLIR